ncbi:MAG: glycosyltransferase family 2 protein [Flavobacterium nitrogenifigens]|uniref:Glycosyltransferase involved in cell wall bisynthesis n=1 Tax=Flavobacterium nitrogenifigens TaxID=1617283 RepID=A0A521EE24_9FLAO|nr:glycosyltransferase family 2 protein [Flavobacterium nitrogenifigens]KAF2325941.1 glycosyltransferase [Flavobacterium nitrogenifigens]MDQ8013046.1 glycosyltransferase family 2 protein [Flavobacterium nitrogenifigens]SMO82092.1 Glycosyltransferase involved in cell wall bisynthesis [Flavobacterium nitrogenifigens]
MPKITIITINYNNLGGLKRTVESVVNQTWKDFEYIVIDGGSTDGSVGYIESQTKYIDYWVSEPDKGIYNAMNKGIVKAKGDYVIFLNSGDHFFDNTALDKNHSFIKAKDFIYFNLNIIDDSKSIIRKYPEKLSFSYLYNDTLPHPATFIRRYLFEEKGLYDESLKIVSDWKFFIENICKNNCSYLKVDETLSTFYLDGLSSDMENKSVIFSEKQFVLESGFSAYIQDMIHLKEFEDVVSNLKKSKKIQLLIKLGLLSKF